MPTLSEDLPLTFPMAEDFSSALLEFHRCQAVQASTDAQAQAAGELNMVVLENQQVLAEHVQHALDVAVEYGRWANAALRELFDAEDALTAAQSLHLSLANAPDAHSPAGQAALHSAYASYVAAGEAYETCRLESIWAEAELETATNYLNTLNKDTPAVFHEETQPLRDAAVAAANRALAAKLDTDAAKERLDALSQVLGHVAAHGSGKCDSDPDIAMASIQAVANVLDSDDAALLRDADITLTGLALLEGSDQVLI